MSLFRVLTARPFLKWAGGKTQLLPFIQQSLPPDFDQEPVTYIEPFIGSGAVFFWMLREYPNIEKAVINDINSDLTEAYKIFQQAPDALVRALDNIEKEYKSLESEEAQKELFLEIRRRFNARTQEAVEQTAYFIFLNRTCFNGLYRVNSKNHFNVPFGRYSNPKILDQENIYNVHEALQKVVILNGDYTKTLEEATDNTFFYFDPPYKPLSKTASFNSYSHETFDDREQVRLKHFCDTLTEREYNWLLSNSDPKNTNPDDHFFEELFHGDHLFIDRVPAKRMINSDASKRGEIWELLISNYAKNVTL
jgi:DNA adenine methylase